MIAGKVLGQQYQVVCALLFLTAGVFETVAAAGHVHLAAHYRLYRRVFACHLQELLHAVHIAVVGDGQGGLSVGFSGIEQLGDGAETVQDRVLRVDVKVNETHILLEADK